MMEQFEKKNKLREQIKIQQEILNRDSDAISISDYKIYKQAIKLPEYKIASFVFCFVSTPAEVDTKPIILHALAGAKRVAVPKCTDVGIMELYEITKLEDLERGKFKIMEPKINCLKVSANEIDFAFVPCLSCDRKGRRLGKGGGYYDRYLAGRTYQTAAICREALMSEEIPVEGWDVKMDLVVTEEHVFRNETTEKS